MLQAGHYSLWTRSVIKPALAPRSVRSAAPTHIQRCHHVQNIAYSLCAGRAGRRHRRYPGGRGAARLGLAAAGGGAAAPREHCDRRCPERGCVRPNGAMLSPLWPALLLRPPTLQPLLTGPCSLPALAPGRRFGRLPNLHPNLAGANGGRTCRATLATIMTPTRLLMPRTARLAVPRARWPVAPWTRHSAPTSTARTRAKSPKTRWTQWMRGGLQAPPRLFSPDAKHIGDTP